MDRSRMPTEFGFTAPSYLPPERARPVWRTLVFGALLALIPVVGGGISAVYIDRRDIPGTYDVGAAFKTALIQIAAIAVLAGLIWLLIVVVLGIGIELNPRLSQSQS
jgi:hypothetical protein